MNKRLIIFLITFFLVAFCSRLLFVGMILNKNGGDASVFMREDAQRYYSLAQQSLGEERDYPKSIDRLPSPYTWDVPGHPLMLALSFRIFGTSLFVAVLVSIFWFSISVCLVALLGVRLFGRNGGLLAGCIYLIYPTLLPYSVYPMAEPFCLAVTLAAVLLFLLFVRSGRKGILFLSGVLFSMAGLIKETSLFVPLIAALYFLLPFFRMPRKTAVNICIFILGASLLIVPASYMYYKSSGHFAPSRKAYVLVKHFQGTIQTFSKARSGDTDRKSSPRERKKRENRWGKRAGKYIKFLAGTGVIGTAELCGGGNNRTVRNKIKRGKGVRGYLDLLRKEGAVYWWMQIAGWIYVAAVFLFFC